MDHFADPNIADNDEMTPRQQNLYLSFSSCAKCSRQGSKRCARCCAAFYCSKVCQERDWPDHRLVCRRRWTLSQSGPVSSSASCHSFMQSYHAIISCESSIYILSGKRGKEQMSYAFTHMENISSSICLPFLRQKFQPQGPNPSLEAQILPVWLKSWIQGSSLSLYAQTLTKHGSSASSGLWSRFTTS